MLCDITSKYEHYTKFTNHQKYSHANVRKLLLKNLGKKIIYIMQHSNTYKSKQITLFDLNSAPNISIVDYIARLSEYMYCQTECFIIAAIYVDRIISNNPHIILTICNVHVLIGIALLLAIKFHDDTYFTNSYYAPIIGLSLNALNKLELEFLRLIDFNAMVNANTYMIHHANFL